MAVGTTLATTMATGCPEPIVCPPGSTLTPEMRCVADEADAGTDTGEMLDARAGDDTGAFDAGPIDTGRVDTGMTGNDTGIPVDAFMRPDAAIDAYTPFDAWAPDACSPSTFYADTDGDGYGNAGASMSGCVMPSGYVANSTDCNDGNNAVHPGATEICNEIDDNCAGGVDEGVLMTLYVDSDGDGYGSSTTRLACAPRAGLVANNTDCNDSNPAIRPGATEICNEIDDNCAGGIDEGVQMTLYIDADGDSFGSTTTGLACAPRPGLVANNTDCNDSNPSIRPGATETCNLIDDNCVGGIDEGVQMTLYIDADGDSFGGTTTGLACAPRPGLVTNNTDCNDSNPSIRPGATETCNLIDDNCLGGIDEGVQTTFYRDADGDTYGSASMTMPACAAPSGYVSNSTDCNDSMSTINPGRTEVCNGVDDNCTGTGDMPTYACTQGASGTPCTTTCGSTGVGTCTATCGIPAAASCTPPAETCNGRDDDCDGRADESLTAVSASTGVSMGAAYVTPLLVPVASGFVSIYRGTDSNDWRMRTISDSGAVGGAAVITGSTSAPYGQSARFDGANVVFSYRDGNDYFVRAFNPTTAATVWGPFTLPRSTSVTNVSKVVDATDSRVTVYFGQASSIRRVRLSIASGVVSVIGSPIDISATNTSSMFDVVGTSSLGDYVAYVDNVGDLRLARSPIGDSAGAFSGLGVIRSATTDPNMLSVALAMRDTTMAVSSTNPLGVVWQRNGVGSYFLPITSTASPSTGLAITVGSTGRPTYLGFPDFVDVLPVSGSTGSHFYVATIENDPAMGGRGTLNVVEVGSTARTLVVAGEVTSLRNGVSLSRSAGGVIRVMSELSTGTVMRTIGCP